MLAHRPAFVTDEQYITPFASSDVNIGSATDIRIDSYWQVQYGCNAILLLSDHQA
jgi:hypothetical protein